MLLLSLMTKLSEELRTVFVLRDIKGKSDQEIAEMLDIPISKVRARLQTARRKIRALLREPKECSNKPTL